MTPYGYGLLADNVARGVRDLLAQQPAALPTS